MYKFKIIRAGAEPRVISTADGLRTLGEFLDANSVSVGETEDILVSGSIVDADTNIQDIRGAVDDDDVCLRITFAKANVEAGR